MSDPFWFQAFGCGTGREWGLFAAGGKGGRLEEKPHRRESRHELRGRAARRGLLRRARRNAEPRGDRERRRATTYRRRRRQGSLARFRTSARLRRHGGKASAFPVDRRPAIARSRSSAGRSIARRSIARTGSGAETPCGVSGAIGAMGAMGAIGALNSVRRDLKKVARPERAKSQCLVFQDRARRLWRGRSVSRRHRSAAPDHRARVPGHAAEVRRHGCCARNGMKNGCLRCSSWSGNTRAPTSATRQAIHQLYLRNTRSINNWDLVDSSAAQIVGAHLEQARSPGAATAGAIEISVGAAHRDDRDVSLHPSERLQGRAHHRRRCCVGTSTTSSTRRSAGC